MVDRKMHYSKSTSSNFIILLILLTCIIAADWFLKVRFLTGSIIFFLSYLYGIGLIMLVSVVFFLNLLVNSIYEKTINRALWKPLVIALIGWINWKFIWADALLI